MPSMTHQTLVSLIREHPSLGARLLQHAGGMKLSRHASLRKTEAQFTDLKPPEYSADAAYLIEDQGGHNRGAVIFEVQLDRKTSKWRSWLQYVATCHAQVEKPVTLVIIALTKSIARWCEKPYLYDHRGNSMLCPVVVGPDEIPRIVDAEEAKAMPALAFLSVAAHGKAAGGEEVGLAALEACGTLPEKDERFFTDFIMASLSQAAQRMLERHMFISNIPKNYQPQGKWAKRLEAKLAARIQKKWRKEGLKEGRKEGLKEGRKEGLKEGRKEGKQVALINLLRLKYRRVPVVVASRIRQAEEAELDRWLKRILTAQSIDEVFA